MKKTLFVTLGLIAIAIGVLVVVPGQINWNSYKDDITSRIHAATGRDVVIEGDLKIGILPSPAVFARDVRLANLPGGASPNMAHLGVLEIRVALAPLFSGKVEVETVKLVDPLIALEILPDGKKNWEFSSVETAPAGSGEPSTTGTPSAGDLSLGKVVIQNGTLLYRDSVSGTEERVEGMDVTLSARSLSGPFTSEGEAQFHGLPIAYSLSVGRIDAKAVPIDLSVGIDQTELRLVAQGALQGIEDAPRFEGKIKAEGSGGDLVSALGAGGTLPGFLGQDITMEGDVRASVDSAESKNMLVRFGDAEAKGAMFFRTKGEDGTPSLDVDMNLARLGLDQWLTKKPIKIQPIAVEDPVKVSITSEGRDLVAIPEKKPAAPADLKGGFSLPKGFSANLGLGVDAITYRSGLISQARINVELANGEITVSQVSALLPGVTNVAAFGFVVEDKGAPAFDGEVEVSSSDVRGLMRWLQIPGLDIPTDRLRTIRYASKLYMTAEEIQARGIDVAFDSSRLTGGLVIALRDRLAFGADLALNQINLDQYLSGPGGTLGATGGAGGADGAAQSQGGGDALSAFAALGAFDANLKATVKSLTYRNVNIGDIGFDGTLHNGGLKLRSLSIGDMAGASARFGGELLGLGGLPEMKNMTFDINAKAPASLTGLAGMKAPGVLDRLGALRLTGTADGSFLRPNVDVSLKAVGGEALLKGQVSFLPLTSPFDGRISLRHDDFNKMLEAIGAGYRPGERLGGVDVGATVALAPDLITLSAIHGQVGPVSLEGSAFIDIASERANVRANLQTGIIPIKAFLPPGKKSSGASSASAGTASASGTSSSPSVPGRARPVSPRWSVEPIDFSGLRAVDADITLAAKGITFDTYWLEAANLHGNLRSGVLTIDRLSGNFFGGPVTGTALIDATGRIPRLQGSLRLTGMDVSKAVKAVSGKDMATGRMSVNLDVAGEGLSVANMTSSLAGKGSLAISKLYVKEGGAGSVLSGVIGLFAGLNDLVSGILPTRKSENDVADISSNFTIKDGVATLSELSFQSPTGTGNATGIVDVAGWWIDAKGQIALPDSLFTQILTKNVGNKPLPFSIKGTLDGPKIVLQTASLGSGIGKILDKTGLGKILGPVMPTGDGAGDTTGNAPPAQVPPEQRAPSDAPQQIKPKEMLDNLLKGILTPQ